VNSSHI